MYGLSDGMQSVVIDGQREWTYGWLFGYEGDDVIVMTGTGDDFAQGGYGDDLLISTGTGFNKLDGQGQQNNNWPNYNQSDFDTFVIGGAGKTVVTDYEVGETLILLDQSLEANDFERVYDFGSDITTFSLLERTLDDGTIVAAREDFLELRGNFEIDNIESKLFSSDKINDYEYGNSSSLDDSHVQFSVSTDVPFETIVGGQSSDTIVAEGGSNTFAQVVALIAYILAQALTLWLFRDRVMWLLTRALAQIR